MTDDRQDTPAPPFAKKLLKRLWGLLPIAALVAIITVLSMMIAAKTDKLDALKKGIDTLEAMELAIGQADGVVSVVQSAKDPNDAAQKLAEKFSLTPDQAKSILHMSIASLAASEKARLEKQIAYIKGQIAANKLDIEPERLDVNVVALALSPRELRDRINLPGVVEPWVKYNIVAEVRGEVREKRIEKGTRVKKGDVIAILDDRDHEIALEAAKASYDTALASKNRLEKLYAEQLASRSQLDDITAQMEQYKAQMDSALLNLERSTIRSPIDGIINDLFVEKGEYVNVAEPVAEVIRMDRIKVSVGIPESDVSAVGRVSEFTVAFDALNGRAYPAKKHFLSRSSDPNARLYKLELEIDNPDNEILPDMFARVDIIKKEVPEAITIPLYSIITLNDVQTVYVVNDNFAHARQIKTGIQEGWRIQVTEGLSPGDRVIVVGHRRVSDGQKVNLIRTIDSMTEL